MNILIVTGNPKQENHTNSIATTYEEVSKNLGNTVQRMNVYSPEYLLPFSYAGKVNETDPEFGTIKKIQDMIMWAEEIVIIHPVWWASMPAGLKNWMDTIFTPRFAYSYNQQGKACSMLDGKKAKVFATAGSYAPYYNFPIVGFFTPLHIMWKYALLGFCGITLTEFKVVDQMNVYDGKPKPGQFEAFLNVITKSAEKH